jgi:ketosteroid isomerase-like protein
MADIELEPVELRTRGLLAYEVGRYRLSVQPTDGPTVVERGHYVQLHEQQPDGTWQRAFELYSSGGSE